MKVNAGKSKVLVLNGEVGLEYELCVDEIRLWHVSEFKYFDWVLDESGIDDAECRRRVEIGRKVAGVIRSLVNVRSLQLECTRALHEALLVPVFKYGSETLMWKEKERSRIKAVQLNNLRVLLRIRRMDKVPKELSE